MTADPTSYAIGDLIPFTAEVYLRLVERQNEALWPLQLPALFLGAAAVVLCWRHRRRSAGLLLSAAWAAVATTFHLRLFAELTFAADYIGGAFLAQAALLLASSFLGGARPGNRNGRVGPETAGYALAALGLIGLPLLAPSRGLGWGASACFGLVPLPTVVVTLGLLPALARRAWLGALLPIPLLWCALAGTIEWALELSLFWLPPAAALIGLTSAAWRAARG